jgi:hypothetical protein
MKTLTNQWYQELRAESEGDDEEEQQREADLEHEFVEHRSTTNTTG